MKTYLEIRKQYPDKTDAQIIEKLLWELGDKVETIGNLLAEVNELKETQKPSEYPKLMYVSDISEERALEDKITRVVISKFGGKYSCGLM